VTQSRSQENETGGDEKKIEKNRSVFRRMPCPKRGCSTIDGMDRMEWETGIRQNYLCPAITVLLFCILSMANQSTFQTIKVKMTLMIIQFNSFQFSLIYWLNS